MRWMQHVANNEVYIEAKLWVEGLRKAKDA